MNACRIPPPALRDMLELRRELELLVLLVLLRRLFGMGGRVRRAGLASMFSAAPAARLKLTDELEPFEPCRSS